MTQNCKSDYNSCPQKLLRVPSLEELQASAAEMLETIQTTVLLQLKLYGRVKEEKAHNKWR